MNIYVIAEYVDRKLIQSIHVHVNKEVMIVLKSMGSNFLQFNSRLKLKMSSR